MDRTLPALRPLTISAEWLRLGAIVAGSWLLLLVEPRAWSGIFDGAAVDWLLYVEAGERIASGLSPYDAAVVECGTACVFRHSPLVAWAFVVLAPLGPVAFGALSLGGLALLPRRYVLAALAMWGLWFGLRTGQVLVFPFVLAVLALRGSRWAGVGFLVLATLMPRPLMIPVAIWLLWRRPDVRLPFLVISAVHALAVLATGYGGEWLASLWGATGDIGNIYNYAPSRWIGLWWTAIGIPLAGLLFLRGHLGLASLAISPYWFPYYLPMALLPALSRRWRQSGSP